ncbi:hypothetical protein [Vagococcus fluvialis]|uniref:hypothetical protein n=1 Tax=Vagococcus fluvialis TaxID=2738 RepID=UPI003B5C8016
MTRNLHETAINWLNENVTWEEIALSKMPEIGLKMHLLNISHSINNFDEAYISKHVSIYSVVKDNLSEIYFSETKSGFMPESNNKNLLFVLIFDNGEYDYVGTNSDRLFLQMMVDIGISEENVKLKSERYLEYKNNKEILETFYSY